MSDANPDKDPDLHPKLMTKPDTDPKKIISNPQLGLPILITEVELKCTALQQLLHHFRPCPWPRFWSSLM
jgi:hypothetical protein